MSDGFEFNVDSDSIGDIERAIVHLIGKYDNIEDQVEILAKKYPEKIEKLETRLEEVSEQVEQVVPNDDEDEDLVDQGTKERLESKSKELSDIPDSLKSVVKYDDPDTEYDDIGGLDEVVRQVREIIEWPLTRPDKLEAMGVDVPAGVLLHGPPGTGKTMIGRAVANESESQFIKISGPELVHSYLGKTSQTIRDLFEFARNNTPCILLFDEIDSIAMDRSANVENAEREMNRVVSQLLTEMDGFDDSDRTNDVRLLATTNKKENIDPALLRPGRLGREIKVPKPDNDGRREIFKHYTAEMPTKELNFSKLIVETRNMSGADIKSICDDAGIRAIRDGCDEARQEDFILACKEAKQSKGRR
jgi:proteasome regulatory subunit